MTDGFVLNTCGMGMLRALRRLEQRITTPSHIADTLQNP